MKIEILKSTWTYPLLSASGIPSSIAGSILYVTGAGSPISYVYENALSNDPTPSDNKLNNIDE